MTRSRPAVFIWVLVFFAVLAWSAIAPKDRITWVLEVAPALIAIVVMIITWNSFPLTPLLYWLVLFHSVVLMIGGHYTYAEVPLFDHIKPWFRFERNNFDKLGHFAQGFVPAIVAREILIRKNIVARKGWTHFIVIAICLAFSAFYELIEWAVAIMSGESAEAFLGTQGYIWDTQTDMAFALLGAILALIFLAVLHNRQIARLKT